jgi:hypothetical protein
MKDIQVLDCMQPELVTLEKVNYFPRQLLTVDDMVTERDYVLQKMRRHNRFLHGWGVVCGLLVKAVPTAAQPWLVQVGGGYALGPYGDEIYVIDPAVLDLSKCGPKAMTDPCNPGRMRPAREGAGGTVYVAIKYAECLSRPVQAMPAGCGCDDDPCEYSRIRDSFQITCLTEPPPSHRPPRQPTLCDIVNGRAIPACPPCPGDPWVVLAQVQLPPSPAAQLDDADIDNRAVRRMIFSVAMIQDQLIRCCCGERQPPVPPAPPEVHADMEIVVKENGLGQIAGTHDRAFLFAIVVHNNGPSTADNVSVTLQTTPLLDGARAKFVPDGVWTPIGGDPKNGVQTSLGSMASGSTKTLPFRAAILHTNKLTVTGTVSSTTNDPVSVNNTSSATNQLG